MKNKTKKMPVFLIATKYKSNPTIVKFYTNEGKHVTKNKVQKERTSAGTQFYIIP